MSTLYGPSIVIDGLVFYLDAGNPKCYVGDGSIMYDLSNRTRWSRIEDFESYSDSQQLTGGDWTDHTGTITVFDYNGNKIVSANETDTRCLVSTGPETGNQYAEIEIMKTGGTTWIGICLKVNIDSGLSELAFACNSINFRLSWYYNGTYYAGDTVIQAGQVGDVLRMEIRGNEVTLLLNGELFTGFTSLPTGQGIFDSLKYKGQFGIYGYGGTINVGSRTYGDNFKIGELPGYFTTNTFSYNNQGSFVFAADNQYIRVPDISAYSNNDPHTYAAWIYPTYLGGYRYIIWNQNDADLGGTSLITDNYHSTPNAIGFMYRGGSGISYSLSSLVLEEWAYITTVYSDALCRFYLNGIFDVSRGTGATTWTASNASTGIGDSYYKSDNFWGNLPMAQIYNRALTDAEVLQNYNATKSRFGL